mgnify:CR=1 FL=1
MDYTKYVLKNRDELEGLLAGKDNFFVVACNKCFKEFNTTEEPECAGFAAIAEEQGKHITGTAKVDFLCNQVQTEKKLAGIVPEGTENVVVISCGLGVQTVADLESVPVFTATNSLNYTGHHGMALTKKTCGACAQCYLNVTGGICPIVDCSKSLVNGQCGGAKNGKCEIDPKKDCAWEKIYQRLEKQGRTKEFLDQPIQLRDYSVTNVDEIKAYVAQARAKRYEGFYGGVHPTENKEFTEHLALQKFPEPDTVIIPLAMHIGAPANPVVQPGDTVKVGQLIGEQAGFISAPVHSSVSGTVIAVEPHTHPNKGPGIMSVVIKNDGKNTLHESVVPNKPLEELTPDEIVEIVKEKGIVGMGGATFPTYVKLKPGKPIDAVLINGSECEPYLTADHRVMLEFADDIVFGLRAMMKAVSAPEGVILIEDNKPDAIALMEEKVAPYDNIRVCAAKTQYPEGAEKMLIKKVMGRQVPSGKLPADVGCVIMNVTSVSSLGKFLKTGIPLVTKRVTVEGDAIAKPQNIEVPIGTLYRDVIDACGGVKEGVELGKIIFGGPMMGGAAPSADFPVLKQNNGLLLFSKKAAALPEPSACIRCGRCIEACPMGLEPVVIAQDFANKDFAALKARCVDLCVACGSCTYACPAKRPVSQTMGLAKGWYMAELRKGGK